MAAPPPGRCLHGSPRSAELFARDKDSTVSNQVLSGEQAFQAMSRFLERYCERTGGKGELAAVLSDMQIMPDGRPADPAAWENWLDAVRMVLEDTPR
jgi:hypothetical protein